LDHDREWLFQVLLSAAAALTLVGCLAAAGASSISGTGDMEKSARTPILVELFTSEGCSSCPPADEYLRKLDSTQPLHGAQIIVLSEHVDYWDHDGWKDPWSSAQLTERQASYVRDAGIGTAFTPEFVVDGDALSSPPTKLGSLLQSEAAVEKAPVNLSGFTIEPGAPGKIRGHVEIDGTSVRHAADVFAALALDHAESQVLHGENGGRKLTHTAVVIAMVKVGKLEKNRPFNQNIALDLKNASDTGNLRVVVFAQESGLGRVVGAALWRP
jgi:hypothetical protein